MRLSLRGLAAAAGLLWGGGILFVGVAHAVWPAYGQAFLDLTASVYPGLTSAPEAVRVVGGALYGVFDGAVAGALAAWLYNRLAS